MTDAAAALAGPAGGTPAAGTPGAPGTPGVAAPAAGASYTWPTDMAAERVDLLKAKGMYDDPSKGVPMLVESYYNANKALSGGDVLVAPTDWTKADQVDKFLGKTRGVMKADEYVPTFGEGVVVNDALKAFSQQLAWEWGVPKALFQKGIDAWQKFAGEQTKNMETANVMRNDAAVKAFEQKVGAEPFKQGVAKAQAAFKALSAKGLISKETLEGVQASIGGSALLELMFAIGNGMAGEAPVLGNGGGAPPTDPTQMSPQQASVEIDRLMGDPEFQKKYNDAKHPEHAVSVQRMLALTEAKVRKAAA